MNEQKPNRIGCFLCGNGLDVRASKRNKPYLVCEACGVQIFVRRQQGIDRLAAKQKAYGERIVAGNDQADLEFIALINRLSELKSTLHKIESDGSNFGFFSKEHPAKAPLKARIEIVERKLRAAVDVNRDIP